MKQLPLSVKRYLYLGNSFLVFLLLGAGYAWSIFVGPLEEWFGWTRAQTSLAFTLNIVCFSAGVILAGLLSSRLRYERIAQVAAALLAGGFLLTTRITAVWQLYFTYSIICGTAVGIMYSAVISTIPVWFRDKTGMATGILIMGYALSTSLLGPVCQHFLSTLGWKVTFLILGTADLLVMGAGSFFIRLPKAKELLELPEGRSAAGCSSRSLTTAQMLRRPEFYFYFVCVVTLGGCGLTVINHFSPLLTGEIGMTAAAAAAAVSAGSVLNGLGRLAGGLVFDKKGAVTTVRILAVSELAAVSAMYAAFCTKNPVPVIVCACMILFFFGGSASIIPSVTRELFGAEHFPKNYSVVSLNALFSAMPASAAGVLHTRTGSYQSMFFLLAVCAGAAVAGAWSMKRKN